MALDTLRIYIAHIYVLSQAAHAVVVLSRQARPEFAQLDVQLHVVDYDDLERLAFALQGVDVVISTISGQEQLNLIQAAVGRVRVFVPSEFEGSLSRRPTHGHDGSDPSGLDRGSAAALELLQQWARQSRIRYTVFSCGLFMERFHPWGLGYLNIGRGSGIASAGDYLVDINRATAEYAERDARGRSVRVCLSSVYDVARFIVAAIDLGTEKWPVEFTMRGDRMTLSELVDTCSRVRNVVFYRQTRSYAELQAYLSYCAHSGDVQRVAYYQRLLATANGRYDFSRATLNEAIERSDLVDVQPLKLSQWLMNMLQSV
ncbi:nmrA-like family domain-containing protein [Hirsutella rhossiliensis]|uniref:NmrA-like family domain-containing protein n=1 Tax=Hirsutella rhossiliensis TaxID=111463 RepID=A0A9P8SI46_9HYPO|nr:nmrA-like family domain-containing protein [Hirsutella rhossiliensis]KAH0963813.1 nmrA-like family domain-containing protein [Hirsutella rhossiliensis]